MSPLLICALVIGIPTETRTLSVYSDYFVGRTMANGEKFTQEKEICAANSWPLGTKLKITHNGKSKVLEVADRMHTRFTGKRVDLPRKWFKFFEDKPDGLHRNATVEVVK